MVGRKRVKRKVKELDLKRKILWWKMPDDEERMNNIKFDIKKKRGRLYDENLSFDVEHMGAYLMAKIKSFCQMAPTETFAIMRRSVLE